MSGRRGFLALVGGAAVSGLVTVRAAARPTLIMPPALVVDPTISAAAYPLLANQPSELRAFLHVKAMVPEDYYLDWIESGLRTARMFRGRDEQTMERLFAERGDRPLCEGDWP